MHHSRHAGWAAPHAVHFLSGAVFCVLFYAVRIVGWFAISYDFWGQVLEAMDADERGWYTFTSAVFLFSNLALSAMQVLK